MEADMKIQSTRISLVILCLTSVFFLFSCVRKEKVEGKGTVTITYAYFGDPRTLKGSTDTINLFMEKNPDINVKIEHMPGAVYSQKMLTEAAAGLMPDVLWMGPECSSYIEKGTLLNLKPLLEKDKEFNMDDFFLELFDAFQYKDGVYVIPVDFTTTVLYYNKDIFEKEGIAFPDETWDWEKLYDVAKKLTKDTDGDGRIDYYGLRGAPYYIFIIQNGGKILNEDFSKCLVDSEEAIEAIKFCNKLMREVSPRRAELREMGGSQFFITGRIAMHYGGRPAVATYRKFVEKFDWDVAPLPHGKKRAAQLWLGGFSISSRTKYPEAAWRLLKFLVGPEGQKIRTEVGESIPACKSVTFSPAFMGIHPPYNNQVFIDSLKYAYLHPTNKFMEGRRIQQIFNDYLELAYLGKITVEEACKKIKEETEKILEERKSEY